MPVFSPSLLSHSKRWVERGLHQILPRVCSLCEQNLEGDRECAARLCSACEERLPGRLAVRCLRCGLAHLDASGDPRHGQDETSLQPFCALDLQEQFPWDAIIAWVDYDYPVDGWVHALKFQREASLAHGLGWGLAQAVLRAPLALQKRVSQLDALIPLPLSRQRLATRGFNQAQLIAESLRRALQSGASPRSNMGFAQKHSLRLDLLRRIKDGPAMSLLASEGRHLLVKNAYAVNNKKQVAYWPKAHRFGTLEHGETLPCQGMRFGLVDDVMTTGGTVAEATRCLKAAGALEVIVLVAARTAK
jgi:predicted amidophosphoribosyltransferase